MKARHTLADMQARIARSAYDALGITAGDVGADHVRAAFLQLTKQFHPAKYARMAPEIQKLANEVFLGLRAAHDQLAKPQKGQRASGPIPVVKTPGPELRPGSGIRPNGIADRNASGVRPMPQDPRTASGARPMPQPDPRPGSGMRPATTAPVQRPGTQPVARAPSPPLQQPQRAPTAQPPAQPPRPATGQVTTVKPAPPQARPPAGLPAKQPTPAVGTARAGTAPIPATPAPAGSHEPELAGVYDLLQKHQFEQARTTLNALIALQPRPRYRALVQYSIGREAQLAKKLDDARVDLLGALEIDPDLQLAKTALAELFTRRK